MKQGNNRPVLKVRLRDSTGIPVNLTGATVRAAIENKGKPEIKFLEDAYVADEVNGEVYLTWQGYETQVPGVYHVEFQVIYPGGDKETFPNDGYLILNVLDMLGG